jgi:hypothetical protein
VSVYPLEWKLAGDRGSYPHMAKNDAVLWERFLDEYGPNFQRFAYDVALGGFLPDGEPDTLSDRQGYQYSTALKIDALGDRGDDLWIIEVRPHAGVSALGSALCSTVLASSDPLADRPLVPVVVTDLTSPDIQLCAEALSVLVIELDRKP